LHVSERAKYRRKQKIRYFDENYKETFEICKIQWRKMPHQEEYKLPPNVKENRKLV